MGFLVGFRDEFALLYHPEFALIAYDILYSEPLKDVVRAHRGRTDGEIVA